MLQQQQPVHSNEKKGDTFPVESGAYRQHNNFGLYRNGDKNNRDPRKKSDLADTSAFQDSNNNTTVCSVDCEPETWLDEPASSYDSQEKPIKRRSWFAGKKSRIGMEASNSELNGTARSSDIEGEKSHGAQPATSHPTTTSKDEFQNGAERNTSIQMTNPNKHKVSTLTSPSSNSGRTSPNSDDGSSADLVRQTSPRANNDDDFEDSDNDSVSTTESERIFGVKGFPYVHEGDEDDDSLVELEGRLNRKNPSKPPVSMIKTSTSKNLTPNPDLTSADIEMCQKLEEEYEIALEEREIGYTARFDSVRQSAAFSVGFMVMCLTLGTVFFMKRADWTLRESLLFSIYTITTVGYGNNAIPQDDFVFQLYTIFFIFVGVATLTIMVAQVYQCIALEASRAQHSRDKSFLEHSGSVKNEGRSQDCVLRMMDAAKNFFQHNEIGRAISVIFPFGGLILVGAAVVGPLEGWNAVESLYFAVVSLTTVGFGDYQPINPASQWFAIFWLPFSVGFMSMFLGSVARFYIRLSNRNIYRIEQTMRRRIDQMKEKAEREREEAIKRAYRGQQFELEAIRETSVLKLSSENDKEEKDESSEAMQTLATEECSPSNSSLSARSAARKSRKRRGPSRRIFESVPTDDTQDSSHNPSSRMNLMGIGVHHSSTFDEDNQGENRRRRVRRMSQARSSKKRTMGTMRDVIMKVKTFESQGSREFLEIGGTKKRTGHRTSMPGGGMGGSVRSVSSEEDGLVPSVNNGSVFSLHLYQQKTMRKAPLSVRVLVMERFANIIAIDIAGYQSAIEIKDNTLSVTIDAMKSTSDKWSIPRRARKAFRAVAFEALYFVGEHGLITRGAEPLFDLTPMQFHGLFSPLLAAMGDADTMEVWLANTNALAEVDLHLPDNDDLNSDIRGSDGESNQNQKPCKSKD